MFLKIWIKFIELKYLFERKFKSRYMSDMVRHGFTRTSYALTRNVEKHSATHIVLMLLCYQTMKLK